MSKAKQLKKAYFDWLMGEYNFQDLETNVVEIGTPFLDNDFDYITMYAEFSNNGRITLTDDGWTLNNLKNYGLTFTGRSTSRNQTLHTIISSLGIERDGDELYISTDLEKFPLAKQRLLQAIMQVNDLIVLADGKTKNIFSDEIEHYFRERNILFTRRPSFAGKEGITVQFDFAVPTNKNEQLIRTITTGNDLNRSKLLTMDTQLLKGHKPEAKYIALVEDINHSFNKENEMKAIFEENTNSPILLMTTSQLYSNPHIITNIA